MAVRTSVLKKCTNYYHHFTMSDITMETRVANYHELASTLPMRCYLATVTMATALTV